MKPIIIEKLSEGLYFLDLYELSSNIGYMTYDTELETLRIIFKSNPKYMYLYIGVKSETFIDMLASESFGKYFCKNIKPNYECKKWNRFTEKYEKVGE